MASANGNTVQHWRADVEASVSSETETTATITVKCYWRALGWGYDVRARGYAGLNSSSATPWKVFTAYAPKGGNNRPLITTYTTTVNKKEHSFTQSCVAVVEVTGGYHNGRSEAWTEVTVPAKTRKNPSNPTLTLSPTNATPSKSVSVSWSANPNGTNLHFKEWRLSAKKTNGQTVSVYTGSATSKTITPSTYGATDSGGTISFTIAAVYTWDGNENSYTATKSLTIPARKNPSAPTIKATPSTVPTAQTSTISWSRVDNGTNLTFKEFRLWVTGANGKRTKIYNGAATSKKVTPSSYANPQGGNITFDVEAVYTWDGKEAIYKKSVTVKVLGGICSVYDEKGNVRKALINVYDEKGNQHFALPTYYDDMGKSHSTI